MFVHVSPPPSLALALSPFGPPPAIMGCLPGKATEILAVFGNAAFELQVAPSLNFQTSVPFLSCGQVLTHFPGRELPRDKWRAYFDGKIGGLHAGPMEQ